MSLSSTARAAILQAAGLVPGPDSFDLAALERLAAARGWTWTTTPACTHHGRPGGWRASVSARPCPPTGAEALAKALAKALATSLARNRPVPAADA